MTLRDMINNAQRFTIDNSPVILTAIGVTGTVTTAYLAGRASFQASKIIEDEKVAKSVRLTGQDDNNFDLEAREKFELVWTLYIPAVASGIGTVGCIIMANRISGRRAAAMAAAYSISERAFTEYREKIVEKMGESKERAARTEIAQERVNNHPPTSSVLVSSDSRPLCQDEFSGRYFRATMEELRKAQNDVNARILHDDFVTVSDYYAMVPDRDLCANGVSDTLGWNTDKLLELSFDAVLTETEGGRTEPVMVVGFASVPLPNPWQFR